MNIPLYIIFGVLIFLLIFLIVFLFLKIRLEIAYKKENEKKGKLNLKVTFFGGKISKELSLKDKQKTKKKGSEKKDEENLTFDEKIREKQLIFKKMRYVWSKSKKKIRKSIFAEKISLDMRVGFEDAFVTGITVGSLWALVYTVIGLLSDIIRIKVPKVNINPLYNEDCFEADAKCTVASSPANIIGIGLKILISYCIIKKKIEKEKAAKNYGNTN